jgi:NADPH-dependent 2,4-dienoyl-CoA reductase/sulfur reductase-like enzyme
MGTQSSSGLNLYGITMVSSGLTLENAKTARIDADSVTIEDNYRPEFMPSTEKVLMTLVWDKKTRQIIGGQLMSKYDVAQSAGVLSLCIQDKHTIDYLAFVDMLFQPNFDRPFNYLNLLAQAAVAKADK